MFTSNNTRMGREVGLIAFKISRIVGCEPCGIGIAIDIVGKRYDEQPYEDWNLNSQDHGCKVAKEGASPVQIQAIAEIVAATLEDLQPREVAPAPANAPPDPRLPPEPEPQAQPDDNIPF